MKKHAIIPIFIPHLGCPHNCVFCNQVVITSRDNDVTVSDARKIIDEWLTTLAPGGKKAVETVEVSFYGGSFTGIPMEKQTEFLRLAKEYKDRGLVDKIHLSTRPDYITVPILDNLKEYSVDTIELGVQSFSEEVLQKSGRGHTREVIYTASEMIKDYGFELGIQLMIGLPGDTYEACIMSAEETVKIGPSIARLYPTVTIEDTEMYSMFERGEFLPLPLSESIRRTKDMYKILTSNGINVIRIGLKSSEAMNSKIGFHPAYKQLVMGEIAKEEIENGICGKEITVKANSKCYGNIFGHKGINREYFRDEYPGLIIHAVVDNSIPDDRYIVEKS
ncbi:MAG: radical SAM protein [Clostridia bacterium]|nr:radical SAM protein [Clostridia bacterium]